MLLPCKLLSKSENTKKNKKALFWLVPQTTKSVKKLTVLKQVLGSYLSGLLLMVEAGADLLQQTALLAEQFPLHLRPFTVHQLRCLRLGSSHGFLQLQHRLALHFIHRFFYTSRKTIQIKIKKRNSSSRESSKYRFGDLFGVIAMVCEIEREDNFGAFGSIIGSIRPVLFSLFFK